MNHPILSLIIPTYNRANELLLLLSDLENIIETHGNCVQVVICNNASTDATGLLIEQYLLSWPKSVKVIARKINLGMEGNIACAMNEGDGKYIWMISDHQRLCIPEIHRAIAVMETLEFDIGHAKVRQWSRVLCTQGKVVIWDAISSQQQGAMLFALGNLSTLIFKKEVGQCTTKSIFRACYWSYPHLGIISLISGTTRFVEFNNMSVFPEGAAGARLVHDYDKISVRYYSNLLCVQKLCRGANIMFNKRGFFTSNYRASFKRDVLHFLLQTKLSRLKALRTLGPIILVNPWSLKLVGVFVLLGVLLVPMNARIRLARAAKDLLIRQRPTRKL